MYNFGGITHINETPNGRYCYVGSIPVELGTIVEATKNDVLGCRAWKDDEGNLKTIRFPSFDKVSDAVDHAIVNGATLCESPDCACRKLFSRE